MKVLLLHPEDVFQRSWANERYDSIVDLGRAPAAFYHNWSQELACPVFSIFDLAVEIEDFRQWHDLMAVGRGQVVDRFGIDWWDVIGLLLQPELQDMRLVQRLSRKIGTCAGLMVTRPSPLANALGLELQCPVAVLYGGIQRRLARSLVRYRRAAANLGFRQLRQVLYDKYDAHYVWRRRFAPAVEKSCEPVILLPSAYTNVTRTAFRYAQLLPQHKFLLVLARETANVVPVPENVRTESLASFAAVRSDAAELRQLDKSWVGLRSLLGSHEEFALAARAGSLDCGGRWLRWAVAVRDAWNAVFENRAIAACLSADDTNPYTRIPLLLARKRGIPAIACHHGALDGVMAFKRPAFSTYLVKGEMEEDYLTRVGQLDRRLLRIGAPFNGAVAPSVWSDRAPFLVFFTEPYETDLWRVEPIYREFMPRLCAAARRAGKRVLVKLHPFESKRQRQQMVNKILQEADRRLVSMTDAPLTRQILEETWCAVTVDSTTAVECAAGGIPVFLCGWLRHSYFGYAPQYARFGVGQMLQGPEDLLRIPEMVPSAIPPRGLRERLVQAIHPDELEEILCRPASATLR